MHFLCTADYGLGVLHPAIFFYPDNCSLTFLPRYGISTLAIVYVHPGFKKALNDPPPSHKGVITAIYYLGTWTSYVFISARVSDKFGRRAATAIGVIINCIGASLLASARNPGGLAMMIIGRIICGIGLAMVSTTVPLYQR
jgi:MFS family permease